ncbi:MULTISPECIES: DUF2069 domain-containing protein [unclassified Variovorax]|jgi:uncharacterized membrane protein|uniref:DUF2069 domain-containing protein n=1 Tax=unclassified Variovorax TaxID=663243 RepID=UPI001997E7FE|nr:MULTISPECIES: DUF2069 domain-containing protein [unclassified Variovorax]MBC7393993.1 DUF2069 domain-containing protein [Variovorax sp.]MEB0058067.1 DUF2069 domain-containing protein [Variovorax sp. LG9.2]MEB0113467.1 DUF2069 domain-containing protein [Variovorax sp. RTB1]
MKTTSPQPSSAAASTAAVPAAPVSSSVVATRRLAVGSLVGLILLGLVWELWLAPIRPGGSLLALKVLPLVVPLAGLLKNRMYTYRWVSLMIWLYFIEGVVRAWSDRNGVGQILALIEVGLCLSLFVACAWHVRTRLSQAAALRNVGNLEGSAP